MDKRWCIFDRQCKSEPREQHSPFLLRLSALYFAEFVYAFHIYTEVTLMRAVQRLQAVIDRLNYDFAAFTVEDFLQHLECRHQRRIQVIALPFAPEIDGVWIPAQSTDYIFVNQALLPFHRDHTILHEVAHLLLQHRGFTVRQVLDEALWRALGDTPVEGYLRAAAPLNAAQDEEAESFVLLIQREVIRAQRLRGEPTSIAAMRPFVHALDFSG
jgi:hypothetical protein